MRLIFFILCFMPISSLQAFDNKASLELKLLLNKAVEQDREKRKEGDEYAYVNKKEQVALLNSIYNLLDNGADPNTLNDFNGTCVIHFAIQFGDMDLVRRYLETGGRLEPRTKPYCYLPLEMAVWSLDIDMIKFILSWGANVHYKRDQKTIIDFAALRLDDEPKKFNIVKNYACRGSRQIAYFHTEIASGPVDRFIAALRGDDQDLCKQINKVSYNGQNAIHTAVSICWNP